MIDKFRKNVLTTVPITSSFDNYHTTLSTSDNSFETNNSLDFITHKLSDEEFNILKMKYQEGYKSAEIGDYYSVTANTINNKISYIKTKLRKSKIK
jgi:DNA-directed RNA polymerase specialized sigma24 family protein